MIFVLAVAATAVVAVISLLKYCLYLPHDQLEPPEITPETTIIGHVLGIIRQGSTYYSKFANKPGVSEVYTLSMPLSKIYVVTTPELMSFVDRRPGIFSFNPILVEFSKRILTVSQPSWEKLARGTLEESGKHELSHDLLRAGQESMKPGDDLDCLTKRMLTSSISFFDGIDFESPESNCHDLYDWCRKYVTVCGTNAIYGKECNPYKNPVVADSLWEIHRDAARLSLNILPKVIARGGCRARETVLKALSDYYAAGGDAYASRLIRDRRVAHEKHQIPQADIERFDMALSFGLLANSVPVASKQEKLVIKVNIKEVMEKYPLLRSFVSEVLRLQTTNVSPRVVQEDTIVGGRYLLKKGNIVMMPSAAAHRGLNSWGSSATEFDPWRFVPQQQKGAEHDHGSPCQQKVPVASHRSWGRGGIVCPGRHFAVNELIVMLVMMVVKYDVVPLSGQWKFPKAKGLVVAGILAPLEQIQASFQELPVFYAIDDVYTSSVIHYPASNALTSSANTGPVYTFLFNHIVHQLPFGTGSCNMEDEEVALSAYIQAAWTRMAEAGNPGPDWAVTGDLNAGSRLE
ncbi:hypothetical protein LA080_007342 [Diaporthe eres]|nr:hypothetical protein LA080_007342 [Diaporthe eres]